MISKLILGACAHHTHHELFGSFGLCFVPSFFRRFCFVGFRQYSPNVKIINASVWLLAEAPQELFIRMFQSRDKGVCVSAWRLQRGSWSNRRTPQCQICQDLAAPFVTALGTLSAAQDGLTQSHQPQQL
jgi:hypothetical protein